MPDYLRDLRDIVHKGEGSPVKRHMVLKKLAKFEMRCRRAGSDVNSHPQRKLCEALAKESEGREAQEAAFRDWMFKLCVARLTRGDFSDWTGWEYRNEWAIASYSTSIPNSRWRREPIKSIAILGEQGIGDEIMYGTCLEDLKSVVPEVVFECDPRLVPIFKRSLGIECKAREDIAKRGQEVVNYLTLKRSEDAFLPVGDLPRFFRKSLSSFPGKAILKPLPEMVEKWEKYKGRVGIAWRSRTGQVDPVILKELSTERPVSLQYDAWEYETEGMEVPDCDVRNDLEDVLGILANLEKVVTVPQTIVHFAGSIGTPVDVVFPPAGSGRVMDTFRWRYLVPKMPWYPNINVYTNLGAYKKR